MIFVFSNLQDILKKRVLTTSAGFVIKEHSHCQDFDIHNLLSELPACGGVVVKGAIIVFQIPGGIHIVNWLIQTQGGKNTHSNIINNKLRKLKCNIMC